MAEFVNARDPGPTELGGTNATLSYDALNYDPRAAPSPHDLASMLEPRIQQHFFESADLSYQAAEAMARPIGDAAQAIVDCVTAGGRVWVHGRGMAQAPAQLLGAALSGRFERDRLGLVAMVLAVDLLLLSTLSESLIDVSAVTQLRVLGQAGDVLVAFALRPDDSLLASVVEAAHDREMSAIVVAGREPGSTTLRGNAQMAMAETDIWIGVPHERPARICELQLLTLHALCDAVDLQLLGDADL